MELEVGGRGKIISNFGFRIANLKARSEVGGKDRGQTTVDSESVRKQSFLRVESSKPPGKEKR